MYLNRLKIESFRAICNVCLAIAAALLFINGIVISIVIGGVFEEFAYIIVLLILEIPMLLLTLGLGAPALDTKSRILRAEKYNRIFEEDHDGIIPYTALASLTGYSLARVKKDVRIMTDRHIFNNIKYDRNGAMIVMKVDTKTDFITVQCTTCGADVVMRANGGARCSHCGTYLRTEN